jgi:transposase
LVYFVVTIVVMYIDISGKGKSRRVLLRRSYREDGKVKKKTAGNISGCTDKEIAAIKYGLSRQDSLPDTPEDSPERELAHGKSVGAVFVAAELAGRLGITKALGKGRQAQLALWQIIARLIDQGSRLSAVRLHQNHCLAEAIDLEKGFCEDDLYENLAWLTSNQANIEDQLFKSRHAGQKTELFLYDVTSSYLEGKYNAFGQYGYNRDGKKGKLQIVVGLLCDQQGDPVSVQVFSGNTSDVTTFGDQVKKVADRFGCQRVTLVGDRGMIKSAQKEELANTGFSYITALTRKQIETLENAGVIQLELFDTQLCEVEKDGIRYLLRRNPCRADEIADSRASKEASVRKLVQKKNEYLAEHAGAKADTALREINSKIEKLNCKWLSVKADDRKITLQSDDVVLKEMSRLDGCYVITTDLPAEVASAEQAHAYYKDLSKVERAFRESKTGHLELRPIHVRKEQSTRGHVFVVMLAYLLRRELERAWDKIDVTMEEGIHALATLSSVKMIVAGKVEIERVPTATGLCSELLEALNVELPEVIVRSTLNVSTKVKTRKRT